MEQRHFKTFRAKFTTHSAFLREDVLQQNDGVGQEVEQYRLPEQDLAQEVIARVMKKERESGRCLSVQSPYIAPAAQWRGCLRLKIVFLVS